MAVATKGAINSVVTDYWMKFYCARHCTVCGNTGIIDTTGAKTPAGVSVGRKNWCFCPNGQAMRSQLGNNVPKVR